MNKVVIITDSTCDLTNELVEKNNIKVIPLHICFEEETYLDGVDINVESLYKKVENCGNLPKTAAVSPKEFYNFLKPFIDEGYDIFYTGIGSKISATLQSFVIAATEFPENRIYYSDSGNLSTGIGLLVLKACKYRDLGYSASKIKELIDATVPHVKVQFVVRTLDYLHKGGRCSSLTKIFGTMLRIRPMIVVRDGLLKVGKKTIGLMSKAVNSMADIFINDLGNVDTDFVFITDSSRAEQSYNEIMKKFNEYDVSSKMKNIFHTTAGCVISSHCGPGTIGILYIMKDGLNDAETLDLNQIE